MATAVAATKRPVPRIADWFGLQSRAARLLVSLPDRLMTWFLAVSAVISISLLVGQFRPWLVFPVAVIAIVLTWRFIPQTPEVNRAAVAGVGGALLLAIAWYLVQRGHTAEMIGLDRDPAQYTLSGLYLMHHPSPGVQLDPALVTLAQQVPSVMTDFLMGNTGAVNNIQGNDLLPGWLAVFGWLHGNAGLFTGNVAIGALALLACYAVARRILGPLWGLAPMLLLALTMPLAAFSRAPYTEPSALIFVSGLLVCLWVAVEKRDLKLFGLAGAFSGGAMIARIDGGLTVVAALAAVSLLAFLPVDPARRRHGRLALLTFLWGAVPTVALGYLDLYVHSPKYLKMLKGELNPVLAAIPLVVVLGLALSLLRPLSLPIARVVRTHRKRVAVIVGIVVALAAIAMVTRPWWVTFHYQKNHDGGDYVGAVAARQKAEGLPIDGTQSYDEMTDTSKTSYLNTTVVAAALVGAVLAAVRIVRRRDPRLLVVWTFPVVVGLVYLNYIAITADQIWALRRLLPVVIPATAIGAVFAMKSLIHLVPRRGLIRALRPLGVLAMLVLLVLPAGTWGPLFKSREAVGEYDFMRQVCALGGDGLIVLAGPYPITGSLLPALQETCSQTVVSVNQPTQSALAQVRTYWTKSPIRVVAFFPDAVTWSKPIDGHTPLAKVVFSRWQSVISHRPESLQLQQASAWVGTLDPTGLVVPLNSNPFPALLPGS